MPQQIHCRAKPVEAGNAARLADRKGSRFRINHFAGCLEDRMRANPIALSSILVSALLFAAEDASAGRLPLTGTAEARPRSELVPPAVGISVTRPNWRREGGFLVAEMTFKNINRSSVNGVIITCAFFGTGGLQLESRSSLIPHSLPPGSTTIGGIEFTMLKGNMLDSGMLGGACSIAATDLRSLAEPPVAPAVE
jgi:hypothetical protein